MDTCTSIFRTISQIHITSLRCSIDAAVVSGSLVDHIWAAISTLYRGRIPHIKTPIFPRCFCCRSARKFINIFHNFQQEQWQTLKWSDASAWSLIVPILHGL